MEIAEEEGDLPVSDIDFLIFFFFLSFADRRNYNLPRG